jgi:hypothetical protein
LHGLRVALLVGRAVSISLAAALHLLAGPAAAQLAKEAVAIRPARARLLLAVLALTDGVGGDVARAGGSGYEEDEEQESQGLWLS